MTESVSDYTISAAGLAGLETELAELEGAGREEIAARIRTAREWGDLKENGEYHAAKEAQAHLETRILYLRDRILNAVVAEGDAGGTVSFGSTVTVRDESRGSEQTLPGLESTLLSCLAHRHSVDRPLMPSRVDRFPGSGGRMWA